MKKNKSGLLLVMSAPSGAGKTTLCEKVRKILPNICYSVSATTRDPRPGERNGRDYFYITEPEFKKMIKADRFLEWAIVHDHYYGTPKDFIRRTLSRGHDVILDIDVQGAMRVMKKYPGGVYIFIAPPSLKELERRLRARKKDTEKTIRRRLKNARKELKFIKKYDYLIVNDKLSDAVKELQSIIVAEKRKTARIIF